MSKGDPVIVQGTIATDSWETDAGRRSATKIRASAVGLNLARGHGEFHRQRPVASGAAVGSAEEAADPGPESFADYADRPTDYREGSATFYPQSAEDSAIEGEPEPAR